MSTLQSFLEKHLIPSRSPRRIFSIEADESVESQVGQFIAERNIETKHLHAQKFVGKPDELLREMQDGFNAKKVVFLYTNEENFESAAFDNLMEWRDHGFFPLLNQGNDSHTNKFPDVVSYLVIVFTGYGGTRQHDIIARLSDYHLNL